MASNAEQTVHQIQHDCQNLMAYVTGPEAHLHIAYEVELTLFRRLLALGAALLRLFFVTRAAIRHERLREGASRMELPRRLVIVALLEGLHARPRHALPAPILCRDVGDTSQHQERCHDPTPERATPRDARHAHPSRTPLHASSTSGCPSRSLSFRYDR